jgi:hypothetical protein
MRVLLNADKESTAKKKAHWDLGRTRGISITQAAVVKTCQAFRNQKTGVSRLWIGFAVFPKDQRPNGSVSFAFLRAGRLMSRRSLTEIGSL